MKKFLMLFIAALLMAACYTSCSSNNDDYNIVEEMKAIIESLVDEYPVEFSFDEKEDGIPGILYLSSGSNTFTIQVEEDGEMVWDEEYNYSELKPVSNLSIAILRDEIKYEHSEGGPAYRFNFSIHFDEDGLKNVHHIELDENQNMHKYLHAAVSEEQESEDSKE